MTDQQQKLEVMVGDEWRPLIATHNVGDVKQYAYVSHEGLMEICSGWVSGERKTRPAPIADEENHVPTAHEPVSGVRLTSVYVNGKGESPVIEVDGEACGYIELYNFTGKITEDRCAIKYQFTNKNPEALTHAPSLRVFRDRIRAERKAKAEAAKVDALDDLIKRCDQWNGHHRTVTFADVAALARIVRDMRATR